VLAQPPVPVPIGMPVIYLHGLGSSCAKEEGGPLMTMLEHSPFNNSIHCVEFGPENVGWSISMMKQGEYACKILTANFQRWQLFRGFILLGVSQGAMVSRYVLEECSIGAYARRYISVGGPQMGVARLPNTNYSSVGKLINNLVDELVYLPFVQDHIGPAGYFRSIRKFDEYIEHSSFLRYFNNEAELNPKYKARMMQLDKFVMIAFTKDTMVYPYQSAHFGEFSDSSQTNTTRMQETDIYKNDLLGLKHLDRTKRIVFYESDSEHMILNAQQVQTFILANLGPF